MNHKQANEPLAFSYSLSLLHFFNLFSFNILYIINQVSPDVSLPSPLFFLLNFSSKSKYPMDFPG